MGLMRFAGGLIKPIFNVKGWLGYNDLKSHTINLAKTVKTGFRPQRATFQETFEEAMNRLNLTDADVQRMHWRYRFQFYLFIVCAALGALYFLHLLWHGHLFAALVMLAITVLTVFISLSGSFYAFQIEHKKLGCTIQEWMDGKISDNGEQA